jgi:hypothetical protein
MERSDYFYVRMALKVVDFLQTKKIKEPHLYIRTETERIDNFFINKPHVEIHLFNQSDLTARCFVKEHPMLDCPGVEIEPETLLVNYDFNLLLLGFGWAGHELLKKCICDAQFKGSTFKATVIDEALKTKYGYYPVLYDECIKEYNLNLISITIGGKAFYEWITENLTSYKRIIVALGNDKTNIDIAITLARILQAKGTKKSDIKNIIFAHVREKKKFGYFKRKDNSSIIIFGDIEEIYTQEMVIQGKMDEVAKMVNYAYCRSDITQLEEKDFNDNKANVETEWKATINFNKDSSRAVVANVKNICTIAKGYDIEKLGTEKLDILAENEHLRWNAFHLVNGIRKWNIEDIPENNTNAKYRDGQNNLLKHGCLVEFKSLKKVTEKINQNIQAYNENDKNKDKKKTEDYQEVDRRIIRHFPLFLKKLNHGK